jgi:hypothetical protein
MLATLARPTKAAQIPSSLLQLEFSLPRIGKVLSRGGEQDAPPNSSETQAGRATNSAGPIKRAGPSLRKQSADKTILQLSNALARPLDSAPRLSRDQ